MDETKQDERVDTVNDDITIIQKKSGLTFGTDAYLLAAYMKARPRARALELGCGTGIISLLAASRGKFDKIYAAEIQPAFCEITKKNIENNSLSGKVELLAGDIRTLSHSDTGGEVDVVFTNPPYMRTDSGKRNSSDEKYIARHEVCGDIGDFCSAAAKMLKFGGQFYCVYRPDRLSELMAAMREASLEPKRMTFVHADSKTPPSMVLVEAKLGAAPSLILTPPLLLYAEGEKQGRREQSEVAARIYETCNFEF